MNGGGGNFSHETQILLKSAYVQQGNKCLKTGEIFLFIIIAAFNEL